MLKFSKKETKTKLKLLKVIKFTQTNQQMHLIKYKLWQILISYAKANLKQHDNLRTRAYQFYVKLFMYRAWGFQEVDSPRFLDSRHM